MRQGSCLCIRLSCLQMFPFDVFFSHHSVCHKLLPFLAKTEGESILVFHIIVTIYSGLYFSQLPFLSNESEKSARPDRLVSDVVTAMKNVARDSPT